MDKTSQIGVQMVTDFCFASEVARRAGITRETLLKWESRGHIPPATRIRVGPSRLDRIYTEQDVMQIIQLAQQRGRGVETERTAA
jgi:DNA-binding transcriptional MerR regulator